MRFAHKAEDRQNEEKAAKGEQSDHQNGSCFVGYACCNLHKFKDLIGQAVNAFLEPQDGENDVGEVGNLFDIWYLTDG